MGQSEYISWVKCTSWLSNFVNLRGLRQPDGRPLYEYHATNDEYNQLTQLLRAVGQSQSNICNKDFAACFVLFALSGTAGIMNGNADGRGTLYIKNRDFIYRHRAWYHRTERDGRLLAAPNSIL